VRRRFGFDDDELERIGDWITEAGARWGFDAAHRTPYKMQNVRQNTWQTGLDRLLVGVAMSEQDLRWLGLALPLDDVDSGSIDLAGRFTELVHRLQVVVAALGAEQTVVEWVAALDDALASLTAVGHADAWQLAQARRELAEVADGAGQRAAQVQLTPSDVRALLADRLQGRPTRAGFRTGNLTMCSMVPMRSVPHRVICLLGLDDGVFPRATGIDGDDVLARDPLVGERDRRSEDRQLLLDAILAAGDKLVVIHTGADERTNAPRPPAVPLGEILDVVDATVATADGRRARERVVDRHPLQPFDARDFAADRPFSFDAAALAGARAAAAPRLTPPPFLAAPLPAVSRTARPQRTGGQITVPLHAVSSFLEHPVRGFLRQRLQVATPKLSEEIADALSVSLDPLQQWSVGDRWLSSRLDGVEPGCARQAEWRRAYLPPGALGTRTLEAVEAAAEPLVVAAAAHAVGETGVRDVALTMSDGCVVVGTVPGVYGHTVLRTVYSRLAPKHRLRAWLQLLALAAAYPDVPWQAVTIGRPPKGPGVVCSVLVPPLGQGHAELAALVDLHARGLREPLPLPLAAAEQYAVKRHRGVQESQALIFAKATYDRDFADDDHDRVWGKDAPFEVITAQPPAAEDLPAGAEAEGTRFGALACQLWLPLLAAETVTRA
jgi:exodeoxyribonuclease V gamma subunit